MKKIKLNLQLFGEGGGAGGAGGAGGEGAGGAEGAEAAAAASQAESQGKAGKGRGTAAAAEDLSQVKYGKQEEQQPEAEPEPAKEPEKPQRKSFDQLLRDDPEYQREMQRRIDNAINKRFAKAKAAEERQSKLAPVLNMIATKYGVDAGDDDALIEAVNADNDIIEQQAMDAGMEPDAYREYTRVKAELDAYKQQEQERQKTEEIQALQNEWRRQADEAKRFYPGMDLSLEVKNERFRDMLQAGVDVKTAFEVVHQNEIMSGLINNAAQEARQKTVASIAAKSNRPRENGASRPQASAVKSDYTKLTIKDFDEIDRRLKRGEIIRY